MYVYTCIYIYIYTYTYIHIYIYIYMYLHYTAVMQLPVKTRSLARRGKSVHDSTRTAHQRAIVTLICDKPVGTLFWNTIYHV